MVVPLYLGQYVKKGFKEYNMVYFICEWYKIVNIMAIDLPSLRIDERKQ